MLEKSVLKETAVSTFSVSCTVNFLSLPSDEIGGGTDRFFDTLAAATR